MNCLGLLVRIVHPSHQGPIGVVGGHERCQDRSVMLQVINRPLSGLRQSYGPPGNRPFPAIMVLHDFGGSLVGL